MGEADGQDGGGGDGAPAPSLSSKDETARSPAKGLRRYAPLLLVAGAALSAYVLVPAMPRDRSVSFRVDDRSITALEVGWFAPGKSEAAQGATFSFSSDAPRTVSERVHLTEGRYELELAIERDGVRETKRKFVQLRDEGELVVPVP